jgi:hypothetical protein
MLSSIKQRMACLGGIEFSRRSIHARVAVRYDPDVPCLVVRWKHCATSRKLRYVNERLIRLIKKRRVRKVLGDDTDLASIAAADQHWILQSWIPRAMNAGLMQAVSIKPRAPFGQIGVNRIVSFIPAGLAVRSFNGLKEGRSSLRRGRQPGTYRIIYRRFGNGNPFNTFAFWCQDPSFRHCCW